MFEKLKNLNKKWYLLLVLLLLGACGSLTAKFYIKQQNMQANAVVQIARSVEQDLLYLDNTSTLKLSPDQAKAILPLIEKMSTANIDSSPSITDLAKQVYGILSPVQYQALTGNGKHGTGKVESEHEYGKKGSRRGDSREFGKEEFNSKSISDPKADALKDMVIKMLKQRSEETSKNPVS